MNIKITSRKFKAKESLKEQIKSELNSLKKFNDDILDAKVILSYTHLENSLKTVEIILSIPGKSFTAEETSDDFGKALTKTVNKLERQLKTLKSKRLAKSR